MNYIDVHCHLDTPDLLGRIKEVVENAKKAGVTIIVANGIDPESNKKVLALAKEYDIIKPALGIYPIDALNREKGQIKNNKFDVDDEIDFIQKNGKAIVAIGEVGLDFVENNEREQKEIFQKMIDLAEKLDKPIEIHSRKAEQEVVDMVLSSKSKKIILHCFCGKKGLWKQAADAGCFFTMPTSIVRAENFQIMAEYISINQLFCETDAPYLSPFKDKTNEPAFVIEAYKKIAEIKDFTIEEVDNNILLNYKKVFG